jgi:hypothetical protein
MPDGDRIHLKLASRYQKIYKQVCEDHFSEQEIAHNLLLPLKEEIRQHGTEVIELIKKCSDWFEQIVIRQEIGDKINWDRENLIIEKLFQRFHAKNTAKELALAACKEQLQDVRHGISTVNLSVEIMRKYMWNLCIAKFASRVPLKKHHHNGADSEVVNARLEGMKQHIWEGLLDFAKQAIHHGNFDFLRRPPLRRQKFTCDNLDIDLTA